MSQEEPIGPYVYQPRAVHPKYGGRLWGVGGLPIGTTCEGLTREEATRIVAALKADPAAASAAPLQPENCPKCGGDGEINGRETNGPEGWTSEGKCPECKGTGRMSEDTRTVRSIAAMLGWMNVPPRETLERDINALKARAAAVPLPPQAQLRALTADDIDQIAEGIESFIMNGDPKVDALWQPYVDKLRALLSASSCEAPAWQPIETAPKDGTGVILLGRCRHAQGDFNPRRACVSWWSTEPKMSPVFEVGWHFAAPGYSDLFDPTHWMPLPPLEH